MLGDRDGPVGTAWATALATPSAGHTPFVAVLRPGVPVAADDPVREQGRHRLRPPRPAHLGRGPSRGGGGVADALADGVVPADQVGALALIAAVWVNPEAD